MNDSLFDYCLLPFAPFAPFAPSNTLLAPPVQRWLDVLASASQSLSQAMANPLGLQGTLYRRPLAGQPDPFRAMACHADAPAWPLDWVDTCSRASAIMSKAQTNVTQRQMELCQSWAAAQRQSTPAAHAKGLHDRIESLHGQTTQAVAQLRDMADEYLEAWFAAVGIVADAWPTSTPGETVGHDEPATPAAAKPARTSKTKSTASRGASRRR